MNQSIDDYTEYGGTIYSVGRKEVPCYWNEIDAKKAAIKEADASRVKVPIYKNTRTLIGYAIPKEAEIENLE